MTEADILATTYEDTVTVYRAFKDTLPGGESVFKSGLDGKVVYEDVECALSTHTGGKLQQSKSTAKTETTFCLFTRPEVDIQTNDFLVITHFGKKIEAVAGFPECMKSHNNIPVKLDKERGVCRAGGIWTPDKRWKGLCKRSPHDGAFPSGSAETPSRLSPGVDE